MSWYVVQTHVGREKQARVAIEEGILEISNPGLKRLFGRVLVPTENQVEIKQGKKGTEKKTREEATFKGYILLEIDEEERTRVEQGSDVEMWKDIWHLVRNARWVKGFVGGARGHGKWNPPAPISEQDLQAVFQRIEQGESEPRPSKMYEVGEIVRIIDGPLKDYEGEVEEVNYERTRMRVMVSIFGRFTPVDVVFDQVEKT